MDSEHYTVSEVELRLSHPTGGDRRTVSLDVIDHESGYALAEFELTPNQFADLLGSRVQTVMAKRPKTRFLSRLFKPRETETYDIPPEFGNKWIWRDSPDLRSKVTDWALQVAEAEGWDEYRVNHGSKRWSATFMRWR